MSEESFIIKSIGRVENGIKEVKEMSKLYMKNEVSNTKSKIIINHELVEGLHKIEEYSHLWVLFYFDKASDRIEKKVYPMGKKEFGEYGVFSSRSMNRPNHIGMKLVKIEHMNGNELVVSGLDAINGTPVIDIKPYIPNYDSVAESFIPSFHMSSG